MEPNNQTTQNPTPQVVASAPAPPPVPAPDSAKGEGGTIHPTPMFGILILILAGLIVVSWFAPVPPECGRGGPSYCDAALPLLLGTPIIIMSAIVGISFLVTVVSSTKGKNFFVKLFGIIIGLCGGFFLFAVGFISSLIGTTRVTGSV